MIKKNNKLTILTYEKRVSLTISCLYLFEHGTQVPIIKYICAKLWLYVTKKYLLCPLKHVWSFLRKKIVPFTQGCFYQVKFKLAQGFSERKKNHECIVPNLLISPIAKGYDPSFERSWILYPMMLVQSLVKIVSLWPVALEK